MRNVAIAAARAFNKTVGWNRLGIGLGLAIMAFALAALYRMLADIDLDKVAVALRDTSPGNIAVAAALVVAAYVTLTFYDWFSLHTIGRPDVPYRVAALASFASYSIGHNLGATVVTGGAIRFRIYSAWRLTIVDVAKIAFVTGLTFWLGNAFVLGLAMALAPRAASTVDQLAPHLNRAIGLAALAAILGYIAWLTIRPRVVGRHDWQVRLPGARLTLVQIAIGFLDLVLSACAMYALLPPEPPLAFVTLLVTFVIATLLGFLSHAPGSLGVFDAAMLVALPQIETEALVAALLLYRLLYFVLPFAIALTLVGGREIWLAARGRRRDAIDRRR